MCTTLMSFVETAGRMLLITIIRAWARELHSSLVFRCVITRRYVDANNRFLFVRRLNGYAQH
jgi:hypothetical protein